MFIMQKKCCFKLCLLSSRCEPWKDIWIINKARYQIIGENVLIFFQGIVLTPNTTTSMTNIVAQSVMMKEKPNVVSLD
jgi:hypothetical protein